MAYEFSIAEKEVREFWEKNNLGILKEYSNNFTVLIPPPNVTGSLHMGHALNNTIQDVFVRYMKLKGKNVCWIPGVDHGGIATQSVVERMLLKEGIKRSEISREELHKRIEKFKEESGMTIMKQLNILGCMLDMSRFRYTMDEVSNKAVFTAFKKLYEDGLIYRADGIVHYCINCSTTLSDIEVEYEEEQTTLYYIKYPFEDGFIVVATVRPETMLGDKAVAVNPADERYRNFIGKYVILPIIEEKIPVVADESVDPSFGTGAVKVTPAHDFADFLVATKNNLEKKTVIGLKGKMINVPAEFEGLDILDARKKVVEVLKSKGLLLKEEKLMHRINKCYRCMNTLETVVLKQWFLKTKPLAEKALNYRVEFYPSQWMNAYERWMLNIRDWCLSRQIVWGHRIPVYYCENGCVNVEVEALRCKYCGSKNLVRDGDVLDTWFSSALWPLTTLGWPDETPDLKNLYPTSMLVTGYEILYLWVARMIMMGVYFMNEIPFKKVIIHGIVRDAKGRKMSKSLGNVVDPLDVIKNYGTDALRYAVTAGVSIGRDLYLNENMFISGRNLANKIYNAGMFVKNAKGTTSEKNTFDRWILSELTTVKKQYFDYMEENSIVVAINLVRNFFWHSFCDWYIEIYKVIENKNLNVLRHVYLEILKMLHPFMPYVTEYLALELYEKTALTELTFALDTYYNEESIKNFLALKDVITNIRWLAKEVAAQNIGILKNGFIEDNISVIRALSRAPVKISEKEYGFRFETPATKILFEILGDKLEFVKKRLLDKLSRIMELKNKFEALMSDKKFHESADEGRLEEIKTKLGNIVKEAELLNKVIKQLL